MSEVIAICKRCEKATRSTYGGGYCWNCHQEEEQAIPETKETGVKQDLSYDRLEWYAYILKRAITNREPLTAWDAAVCITGHFDNVYGHSQEREDARHVDSFEGKK